MARVVSVVGEQKQVSFLDKFGDLDVFLSADNAQLEIRVLAQMSQDRKLIDLIKSGEDIHSSVGHVLTGIPIEKIKKDRAIRTTVKGIHFGIVYGLTAKSLYWKLKTEASEKGEEFTMTEEEVTSLHTAYFLKFGSVKKWLEGRVEFAQTYGYAPTLFGFKREISPFGDDDRSTFWANQAKNSPIQGTAHQLLLISLAILELKKKSYNLLQRLTMEGHDALVSYVKLRDLPEARRQMLYLLETDVLVYVKKWWPEVNWEVPLKAEAKAGFRYGVKIDYEGESPKEFARKWCEENYSFEQKLKEEMQK
jgi:DNA polymerase I-like protein with 3'-5' exonuclease and polymerase domains